MFRRYRGSLVRGFKDQIELHKSDWLIKLFSGSLSLGSILEGVPFFAKSLYVLGLLFFWDCKFQWLIWSTPAWFVDVTRIAHVSSAQYIAVWLSDFSQVF